MKNASLDGPSRFLPSEVLEGVVNVSRREWDVFRLKVDEARHWLFDEGSPVERYTKAEYEKAWMESRQFSGGIKTNEYVANALAAVDTGLWMLGGLPNKAWDIAKSPTGRVVASAVVAATIGLVVVDSAYGSGVGTVHALDVEHSGNAVLEYGQFSGVSHELGIGHVAKLVTSTELTDNQTSLQGQLLNKLDGLGFDPGTTNVMFVDLLSDANRVSKLEGRAPAGMGPTGTMAIIGANEDNGGKLQFFILGAKNANGELKAITDVDDKVVLSLLDQGDQGGFGIVTPKGFQRLLDISGGSASHVNASLIMSDGRDLPTAEWTSPGQAASLNSSDVFAAVGPEFADLQTKIASGNNFTLMIDGSVWQKLPDKSWSVVNGIQAERDGSGFNLTVDGNQVRLDKSDVDFSGDKGISVAGYTLGENRKWGVEAIKEYSICKIERFYDCVVPYEDLENGDYWRWLQTLSKPFDPLKVKDIPLITQTFRSVTEKTEIIYDTSGGPNFADPSVMPFRRDVTSGIVYYEYNGIRSYGALRPIEFYDKNDPTNNKWIIAIESLYYEREDVTPQNNQYLQWDIDTWKRWMRVTPILTTTYGRLGLEDPLVKDTFERYPDMQARFQRFVAGDVGALSGPDIFLLTRTIRDTGNTYK